MSLKVTWEANATGAPIPLFVDDATSVSIVVLDDTGSPTGVPHKLSAEIRYTTRTEPAELAALPGSAATCTVRVPQRWYWRAPRLLVSAEPLDRTTPWAQRSLLIVTRPMYRPARAAMFVGSLSLLYLLILFPQLEKVSDFVQPGASFLAIAVLAAKWLRIRILGQLANPRVAIPVAIVLLGLSGTLMWRAKMVVNYSLDTIPTASGEVAPAAYAIVLEEPGYEAPRCHLTDTSRDCVAFDGPSNFWFGIAKYLARHAEVGCVNQPLLAQRKQLWKAQKRCLPTSPPPEPIEHMTPGEVFDKAWPGGDEIKVAFNEAADAGPFQLRDVAKYRTLEFSSAGGGSAGADDSDDLELRMEGAHAVREIRATLRGGSIHTPAEVGDRSSILPATLVSSSLVVGEMMATLNGTSTPCDVATTGQRLSALVLRDGQSVYHFTVAAPDFVRRVPVCWAGAGRPTYGEIRLDGAWTPSLDWALSLADRDVAFSITVLDNTGMALGQLTCPVTQDTHTDVTWTMGPLRIEDTRAEFGEVRLAREGATVWRAASVRAANPWVWACWHDKAPAQIYGAHGWIGARAGDDRVYRVTRSLRACRCYMNGQEAPAGKCASPLPDDLARGWYAQGYGPGDCDLDPKRSKLCPAEGSR